MLDENSPVCEICNKSFKSIFGYKEHLFKHIDIPLLYYCPSLLVDIVCVERFSNMKGLSQHILKDHSSLSKALLKMTKLRNFKNTIRLKIYIYVQDFYNLYGGRNYLLNGGMCLRCLKCPEKKIHRCIKHSIDLTFCLFCNKRLGNVDMFKHVFSKCCSRAVPKFFRSSLRKNIQKASEITGLLSCEQMTYKNDPKATNDFKLRVLLDDLETVKDCNYAVHSPLEP